MSPMLVTREQCIAKLSHHYGRKPGPRLFERMLREGGQGNGAVPVSEHDYRRYAEGAPLPEYVVAAYRRYCGGDCAMVIQ